MPVSYTHLDVYKRQVEGLTFSPVRGQNGNIEYLLLLRAGAAKAPSAPAGTEIAAAVRQAHEALQQDKKSR